MSLLKGFVLFVNGLNEKVGKIVSFLVFPMIGLLCWEVFMRYVLNSPTMYASELSAMTYSAFFLLGAGYTLKWDAHIRVDIIYNSFSPRGRAILDLITFTLFYVFCSILLVQGVGFAWDSIIRMERSSTVWEPFIWPAKLCIPLGGFLILLQGLAKTVRDMFLAITGHDLFVNEVERGTNS